MAVYILQPKLLSFNYSFSSISQPVLSPLGRLHLYNSQYPRNDLPEQPLPILPLVQTLLYSFLECERFFLRYWQKKKGQRRLCKGFRRGNNHGWKEENRSPCAQRLSLQKASLAHVDHGAASRGRAPCSGQATGRGSGDATLASPRRVRQYLSSPIALTFYWQSPRLCSAEVSV